MGACTAGTDDDGVCIAAIEVERTAEQARRTVVRSAGTSYNKVPDTF